MGSSGNCSFFKPSLAIALCHNKSLNNCFCLYLYLKMDRLLQTLWFLLKNLLYFEAIFGNLVMLWKKPKQLYFYISNSIFTSLLENGRENSKEVLQTPPLPPGGVQSMMCPSGDHPKAKTFPTTPHMTL